MTRLVPIALIALAATMGAVSYAFAHMDYRQREEYAWRLYSGEHPEAPSRQNLNVALALGIPAAPIGAIGITLAIFELRPFKRREIPETSRAND